MLGGHVGAPLRTAAKLRGSRRQLSQLFLVNIVRTVSWFLSAPVRKGGSCSIVRTVGMSARSEQLRQLARKSAVPSAKAADPESKVCGGE
jgi:hypothetical protein